MGEESFSAFERETFCLTVSSMWSCSGEARTLALSATRVRRTRIIGPHRAAEVSAGQS